MKRGLPDLRSRRRFSNRTWPLSHNPDVMATTSTPCPSCGHPSPPGFRFCGACGVALERVLRSMTTVAFLDHPEVANALEKSRLAATGA